MLVGTNITKSFCGEVILHDVTFTIKRGEITVVIGPSGAGKTTLLRALSLVDPPDTGTIIFAQGASHEETYSFPNHNGRSLAPPWPRVTVVFQQLFLWPHLTLRDNIWLPVRSWDKQKKARDLKTLIDVFDMGDFIDRYPNQASLGQRQRAALVRAFLLEPEYLFLDEVTSALDVLQTTALLSHLQSLRDKGTGILLITHLLGFARRAADAIAFFEKGRVAESGGPEILDFPKTLSLQQFLSLAKSDRKEISQLQHLADGVMAHIRAGHFPEEKEAEFLNRIPLIDILRRMVEEGDVPQLLNIVENKSDASAALALSLLRHFCTREDVKTRLRIRWDSQSANTFLRCYLLWRLLDDPDLPSEWHTRLFNFILDEWTTFKNVQVMFWGSSQNTLQAVSERVVDSSFPETKKWAYLCCLPEVQDDKNKAEELLLNGLKSDNPFTREVAGNLLHHFFSIESK